MKKLTISFLGMLLGFTIFTSRPLSCADLSDLPPIQFVSPTGNDSNTGRSWETAKRTIYAALEALPGGNALERIAGSGTVIVSSKSSANPMPGAGIWLMGPRDPAFTAPAPGWLRCNVCAITVSATPSVAAGPNGALPRAFILAGSNKDNNHPGIWLSATSSPIHFVNLEFTYPGRAILVGECFNHDRSGKCGVQSVTFDNTGAEIAQTPSTGPCSDITGGSFWIYLNNFGCSGNAYHAAGGYSADNAAALLVDGASNVGNGLIFLNHVNFAGGGLKFRPGSNGGSLYAYDVIEEGNFSNIIPPTIWFTGFGGFVEAVLKDIQLADAGPQGIVVQNDGDAPGPSIEGLATGSVRGPATILSSYNNTLMNTEISPTRNRQVGFFNGYVVGETDAARRIGGLVPTRFVNHAITSPAKWTTTNYTGSSKINVGEPDPFGSTGAATAISSRKTPQEVLRTGCYSYSQQTAGDWVIGGAWVRGPLGGRTLVNAVQLDSCGTQTPHWATSRGASTYQTGMIFGDGQWQFQWFAYKVREDSVAVDDVGLIAFFTSEFPVTLYGPLLYIIKRGTLSDNEVLEFAATMNSVDAECPQGSVCNVSGHPINSDVLSLRNGGHSMNLVAGSLSGNRTVKLADPGVDAHIPFVIYENLSPSQRQNMPPAAMALKISSRHQYQFDWVISLTSPGANCIGTTTVELDISFTDPNSDKTKRLPLATVPLAENGNGTSGYVASGVQTIEAKEGSSISYWTSGYTIGTGCTRSPEYQIAGTLLQVR